MLHLHTAHHFVNQQTRERSWTLYNVKCRLTVILIQYALCSNKFCTYVDYRHSSIVFYNARKAGLNMICHSVSEQLNVSSNFFTCGSASRRVFLRTSKKWNWECSFFAGALSADEVQVCDSRPTSVTFLNLSLTLTNSHFCHYSFNLIFIDVCQSQHFVYYCNNRRNKRLSHQWLLVYNDWLFLFCVYQLVQLKVVDLPSWSLTAVPAVRPSMRWRSKVAGLRQLTRRTTPRVSMIKPTDLWNISRCRASCSHRIKSWSHR